MPHDARSLVASANFLGSRFVFVIDHIERGVEQVMIVHGAFVRVRGEQFTARDRRLDRNKLVNAFGFESLGEEGLTAIRCDDVLPPVRQVGGTEQDSRVNASSGTLGKIRTPPFSFVTWNCAKAGCRRARTRRRQITEAC